MGPQKNPKPSNPYSEKNVREFLAREFANNQVMRWRLTNLINGIREYERENAKQSKSQTAAQ